MSEQSTLGLLVSELRMANAAVNSLTCFSDIEKAGEMEIMRDLRHVRRNTENAAKLANELVDLIKNREV